MNIKSGISLLKVKANGTIIFTDANAQVRIEASTNHPNYSKWEALYAEFRSCDSGDRSALFDSRLDAIAALGNGNPDAADVPPAPVDPKTVIKDGVKKLLNFFTEFEFEPNFRFVNSLAWALTKSKSNGCEYVRNYFKLVDSPYVKEVIAKMKSPEWSSICSDLRTAPPSSVINSRFKIYYGSAGTGKTTLAQSEANGRCVVCNNAMLPSDLMEDFVFTEGKPTFKPSALWECMLNGTPIVLDEINLLPFDSLRFLQGILDGKKEFMYKGHTVTIADGFQVIGTMNLVVNGAVFNLPEPLVDRASEMREFKLTADNLMAAIL